VFLISDFQQPDLRRALAVTSQRHDLVAISITDPRELTIPDVGMIDLEDAETGQRMLIDTGSRRVRMEIEGRLRARRDALVKTLRALDIDHIDLRTDQDFAGALIRFFQQRAARMGGGR
jgi:uncharacterized protein (DUF58 family)